MKRLIVFVLVIFCLAQTSVLAADGRLIPVCNAAGQVLPIDPGVVVVEDTVLVPLRAVAEYLEAAVVWQPDGKVSLAKDNCQIFLSVGQQEALKQRGSQTETLYLAAAPLKQRGSQTETLYLAAAPQYQAGALYVPLRFVAEALDTPVSYCVNDTDDPHDIKCPAIFLGESSYAENYGFEDLRRSNGDPELIAQMRQELFDNGVYSWDELNLIFSVFVREVMSLYTESCNIPESFSKNLPAIRSYYAFYIADEVLASQGWQQYLALARHQRREMDIAPLQLTISEDKIIGTYGLELFAGFVFMPLLAEVEITRCDDAVKALAPEDPSRGYPIDPERENSLVDDNGHMWRITKVSNPRAYVNLQALRDNEPEMYARWLASSDLF